MKERPWALFGNGITAGVLLTSMVVFAFGPTMPDAAQRAAVVSGHAEWGHDEKGVPEFQWRACAHCRAKDPSHGSEAK